MSLRLLLCCAIAMLGVAGCLRDPKEKPGTTSAAQKKKDERPKEPTIKDQSNDPSFQAFVGRLRVAVAQKDRHELAQVMVQPFGYRWDDPPPGETPFDYWDKNNSWTELEALLTMRFQPSESYMVSPPKFASDPTYRGYRVGLRQDHGSWRFVYFVTGEDLLQ